MGAGERPWSGQRCAFTPSDHERCHAGLHHVPSGDCVGLCRDHGGKASKSLYAPGFGRVSGSVRDGSQQPRRGQTKKTWGVSGQPAFQRGIPHDFQIS